MENPGGPKQGTPIQLHVWSGRSGRRLFPSAPDAPKSTSSDQNDAEEGAEEKELQQPETPPLSWSGRSSRSASPVPDTLESSRASSPAPSTPSTPEPAAALLPRVFRDPGDPRNYVGRAHAHIIRQGIYIGRTYRAAECRVDDDLETRPVPPRRRHTLRTAAEIDQDFEQRGYRHFRSIFNRFSTRELMDHVAHPIYPKAPTAFAPDVAGRSILPGSGPTPAEMHATQQQRAQRVQEIREADWDELGDGDGDGGRYREAAYDDYMRGNIYTTRWRTASVRFVRFVGGPVVATVDFGNQNVECVDFVGESPGIRYAYEFEEIDNVEQEKEEAPGSGGRIPDIHPYGYIHAQLFTITRFLILFGLLVEDNDLKLARLKRAYRLLTQFYLENPQVADNCFSPIEQDVVLVEWLGRQSQSEEDDGDENCGDDDETDQLMTLSNMRRSRRSAEETRRHEDDDDDDDEDDDDEKGDAENDTDAVEDDATKTKNVWQAFCSNNNVALDSEEFQLAQSRARGIIAPVSVLAVLRAAAGEIQRVDRQIAAAQAAIEARQRAAQEALRREESRQAAQRFMLAVDVDEPAEPAGLAAVERERSRIHRDARVADLERPGPLEIAVNARRWGLRVRHWDVRKPISVSDETLADCYFAALGRAAMERLNNQQLGTLDVFAFSSRRCACCCRRCIGDGSLETMRNAARWDYERRVDMAADRLGVVVRRLTPFVYDEGVERMVDYDEGPEVEASQQYRRLREAEARACEINGPPPAYQYPAAQTAPDPQRFEQSVDNLNHHIHAQQGDASTTPGTAGHTDWWGEGRDAEDMDPVPAYRDSDYKNVNGNEHTPILPPPYYRTLEAHPVPTTSARHMQIRRGIESHRIRTPWQESPLAVSLRVEDLQLTLAHNQQEAGGVSYDVADERLRPTGYDLGEYYRHGDPEN